MNNNRNLVTIIMNCRNGEKYLKEAIDSIYRQTYPDWEIVFWDNLSTDKSPEIAKGYDRRLRYFRGDAMESLGKARNLAISQARGEFIAFLDTDDLWMSRKLEKQIPLFLNNSVGLVFSDVANLFQAEKNYYTQFSTLNRLPPKGKIFDYLLLRYGISMPSVVLRRKALESVAEMFDHTFEFSTDYDLFLRIAYNWECDYVAEPLAVYRIHQSLGQSSLSQYEAKERARTLEKLCILHPEMKDRFKSLLEVNSRNITVVHGRWLWRQGKIAEARKVFKQNLKNYKVFFIYFATFLPYGLVIRLWSMFQETIHNRMRRKSFTGSENIIGVYK